MNNSDMNELRKDPFAVWMLIGALVEGRFHRRQLALKAGMNIGPKRYLLRYSHSAVRQRDDAEVTIIIKLDHNSPKPIEKVYKLTVAEILTLCEPQTNAPAKPSSKKSTLKGDGSAEPVKAKSPKEKASASQPK